MFVVSGGKGIGKTRIILQRAKQDDAIIVCEDPVKTRKRAYLYGITGINIISYEEFDSMERILEPVYILSINKYLLHKNKNVKGYSVCNEG